jgi:hypothetical protein
MSDENSIFAEDKIESTERAKIQRSLRRQYNQLRLVPSTRLKSKPKQNPTPEDTGLGLDKWDKIRREDSRFTPK